MKQQYQEIYAYSSDVESNLKLKNLIYGLPILGSVYALNRMKGSNLYKKIITLSFEVAKYPSWIGTIICLNDPEPQYVMGTMIYTLAHILISYFQKKFVDKCLEPKPEKIIEGPLLY